MRFIERLFHRHNFIPKKIKYPVWVYTRYTSTDKGSIIFEKCKCGGKRIREVVYKAEIFEGFVVEG